MRPNRANNEEILHSNVGDMTHEPRKRHHRSLNYSALIDLGDGLAPLKCKIQDVSRHGACLEAKTPTAIPTEFTLLLAGCHGARRYCRVIWRDAALIGVEFTLKDPSVSKPQSQRAAIAPAQASAVQDPESAGETISLDV
jgi:hypothetical protein